MSDKLKFLRNETDIPGRLLDQINSVFDYRDRLAHSKLQLFDRKVFTVKVVKQLNDSGRGDDLDEAVDKSLSEREAEGKSLRELAEEFETQ